VTVKVTVLLGRGPSRSGDFSSPVTVTGVAVSDGGVNVGVLVGVRVGVAVDVLEGLGVADG
jgi:hypothetical protein